MSFILRPFQSEAEQGVYEAWERGATIDGAWSPHANILLRMDTGAGKTVVASEIFRRHQGASCLIAHRQELVGQLSLALATQGVYHNIIASEKIVRFIASYHVRACGQSFFHPQAPCTVAGVRSLIRRDLGQWAHQVTLWGMDEAHHLQVGNEWGKAVKLFPNARGVGFSATPGRADGKGLGRHAHGVFDAMVEGPPMRWLIEQGYLTDYKIFAPRSDMDLTSVDVSKATGDFNPNQLRDASHKSHIVGDVVDQYLRIAPGKIGITFAVDVETATEIADRYRHMGVPAEVISAKTPMPIRVELMERLKRGDLKNLVNVDLFGEGTDVPGIEVISKARPTQSYSLYAQQFGRPLRILASNPKKVALIIDHVGNCIRHGLPDAPRKWSLDARERGTRGKRDETVEQVTACPQCIGVYKRVLVACPYCGHRPEPAGRSRPEQVDGDLFELTPEALAQLRGMTVGMQKPADEQLKDWCGNKAPTQQQYMMHSQVKKKQAAAAELVDAINLWGAHSEQIGGDSRRESHRRFYQRFGIDYMTAQSLGRKESKELKLKIQDDMVQRWQT